MEKLCMANHPQPQAFKIRIAVWGAVHVNMFLGLWVVGGGGESDTNPPLEEKAANAARHAYKLYIYIYIYNYIYIYIYICMCV